MMTGRSGTSVWTLLGTGSHRRGSYLFQALSPRDFIFQTRGPTPSLPPQGADLTGSFFSRTLHSRTWTRRLGLAGGLATARSRPDLESASAGVPHRVHWASRRQADRWGVALRLQFAFLTGCFAFPRTGHRLLFRCFARWAVLLKGFRFQSRTFVPLF